MKLKRVKDEQIGIDFTSNNIDNLKEMINHIKSVNSDYDIVKVLLYLSEKYYANKKEQKNIKFTLAIRNLCMILRSFLKFH